MSITITRPDIRGVTVSPYPATINGVMTIAVEVVDVSVVLEPEVRYSGEFYSGEG